ncbi:flagellar biosynthetic protein FliO [Mangrovimicrobium sediminis]|uniref:Flagellar protein n=1 Tax=Mangrovimicrobium sediminis TaxID=2562682 RepID=A0A4Z0M1H3_9GAMM|nr:flagellar biosynthetic protein FliO [Haliea sp. SAOS-164]TGD73145.1 flagellar biosynthetic protein FliO [Haliea sp. SAOS-164]
METDTLAAGGVDTISSMAMLGKTALSLLFIVALILALSYLLRRLNRSGGSGRQLLRQVASTSLGPRERVVVVEFNGTWLVLGVGGGQVNKLHETPADPELAASGQAGQFARQLAGRLQGGDSAAATGKQP